MIYLTSDNHFFHRNVIAYCNRPFTSQEEMHEALIKNWNDIVTPEDTIYILGDFSFGKAGETEEIVKRLSGHKHLILGNHDGHSATRYRAMGFETVEYKGTIEHDGRKINLAHIPYVDLAYTDLQQTDMRIQKYGAKYGMPNDGNVLMCGHVHCAWKTSHNLMINVGVDVHNFKPVEINELLKLLETNLTT